MDPPLLETLLSNGWYCSCFQTSHNLEWSEKKKKSKNVNTTFTRICPFLEDAECPISLSPACESQIWTPVAGFPGGSGTGCCGSGGPPEPTRWCSRWCSRPEDGSSRLCSWSDRHWKIRSHLVSASVLCSTVRILSTDRKSLWNCNMPLKHLKPCTYFLIMAVLESLGVASWLQIQVKTRPWLALWCGWGFGALLLAFIFIGL